jgi:hypothetical protein
MPIPRAAPRSACPPTVRAGLRGWGVTAAGGRPVGLAEPGLTAGLGRWRAAHDPGKIITDLVMTLALDGDCLADIGVLPSSRTWPVASDPVASRVTVTRPWWLRAIRTAQGRGPRACLAPGR